MDVATALEIDEFLEQSNAADPFGVFDDARYARLAVEQAPRYQSAGPFPHIVLDDFLPVPLARSLAAAFPDPRASRWVERNNVNNRRRYQHDETQLPRLLRTMLRELNSRQFVLFLETLTGIPSLLPDPYFIGGGVHMSTTGDFLKIHADFNWHHKLQAWRRVNVLIYLPETWEPEWQGALEFWDRDMSGPVVSALPLFNRMVVFSTGEHSHHGQRLPNLCPPGLQRKVLNLYYYTSGRTDGDIAAPHFTLYKPEASSFAMELGNEYRRSGGDVTAVNVKHG
ncbi:MAG: 2OG-Fe(II) oxygenase [Proteobacteria bacterium]|nr:MAG: 2OG-Fe(II) oxygenase [Pseudomonadota bacterium]